MCCLRSQWQLQQPVLLVWICIIYHLSVTHYKCPYDAQMIWNKSALGSVLTPSTSNRNITVTLLDTETSRLIVK